MVIVLFCSKMSKKWDPVTVKNLWTIPRDYELARLVKKELILEQEMRCPVCDYNFQKELDKSWARIASRLKVPKKLCENRWDFLLDRHQKFLTDSATMGRKTLSKYSSRVMFTALGFLLGKMERLLCKMCVDEKKKKVGNENCRPARTKVVIPVEFFGFPSENISCFSYDGSSFLYELHQRERKKLISCLRKDSKYKRLLSLI